MKKMDDFEIDLNDAAITFGEDGKVNLYMPKYEDDDTLDPNKHQHVFTAIAIMMLFDDKRFNELVNEKVNIIMFGANNAEA